MHKMMDWNSDTIRFMHDASQATSYYETLALSLKPYLEGCSNVCDAGCGLGQLSASVSSFVEHVDAVDVNQNAIDYLKSQTKNKPSIHPLCTDLFTFEPKQKYDAMIFNNFGSMEEILAISNRLCKGVTIIIKRDYPNHRFSIGENKIEDYCASSAVDFLNSHKIEYYCFPFECEFGQPFESLDDAVLFFNIYSRDKNSSLITRESVLQKLEKTDNLDFPYYLRSVKKSKVFVI